MASADGNCSALTEVTLPEPAANGRPLPTRSLRCAHGGGAALLCPKLQDNCLQLSCTAAGRDDVERGPETGSGPVDAKI